MDVMFWVWLGVIIVTAIIEFATMEIASIWFTLGAIIPFILAATNAVRWEIQLVIFVVISAVLIASLRKITMKFLLKNNNEKTNVHSLVGQQHRMLTFTDFEHVGSVKINDVIWSAVGEKQQTIEKDEIVEIVKVQGNKLIVKKFEKENVLVKNKENDIDKKKIEQKDELQTKSVKTTKKSSKKDVKSEKGEK